MRHLMVLSIFLQLAGALGSTEKLPRLKFTVKDAVGFHFPDPETHTTFFHELGTGSLYVGGRGLLYVLQFTESDVKTTQIPVTVNEKAKKTCLSKLNVPQSECENFITVIHKVNSSLLICGTNAGAPKCWLLVNGTELTDSTASGLQVVPADISPPFPSQRVVSLSAEGSLYSALSAAGSFNGSLRRTYSHRKLLKNEDKWLQNPQFAGSALVPGNEKHKEEAYFFFSELNKTASVDEEPHRARIGRVCMVDEGGVRNAPPDSWTTFLKARVMCGVPSKPQQFNQLREAYALTGERGAAGLLYGIFSNAWNTTVVCVYSIEEVNQVFQTSKLKGYSNTLPAQRPGTCLFKNATNSLPWKILGVIRDHPEMEDVIYPLGQRPLDLPTTDRYTRTVASSAQGVNEEVYSVLYLGTDSGKVLKVLHSSEEAFIISQYRLFRDEAAVTAMAIDDSTGHLYVGTSLEVRRIPLADCGRYGDTCRGCVLSRDPYCGWDLTNQKCSPIPRGYNTSDGDFLQNLDYSNASICGNAADLQPQRTSPREVILDSDSPILLPCPVRSHHAVYTWEKDNCIKSYTCPVTGESCLLVSTEDLPMDPGVFRCSALEDGFREEIVSYRLVFNSAPLWAPSAALAALCTALGSALMWV
ncbi:semaphorin-7A [Huso huso]|uniref:Semaphorin-7A n=1 Tax=Huso huso TaxID=61971 RepID=A0ABR0YFH9_HUSHU